MHSDCKKRCSFLALLYAAGDVRRYAFLWSVIVNDAIRGAVVAVVSSLLVAILFAYVFRIPIPLCGMLGPW